MTRGASGESMTANLSCMNQLNICGRDSSLETDEFVAVAAAAAALI